MFPKWLPFLILLVICYSDIISGDRLISNFPCVFHKGIFNIYFLLWYVKHLCPYLLRDLMFASTQPYHVHVRSVLFSC